MGEPHTAEYMRMMSGLTVLGMAELGIIKLGAYDKLKTGDSRASEWSVVEYQTKVEH